MEEKIKELVGDKLDKLKVWIDSVTLEKEDSETFLRIALDAEFIIPLSTVVMATRIINPILDKMDIELDNYILDVYAKEKGDVTNE
ncbi:MAG: hypothetical protein IJO43_01065 [Bacilli bacterium]|nr:hypothetical protein [Bacilli bacterium]